MHCFQLTAKLEIFEHKPREFGAPCWARQVLLCVTITATSHSASSCPFFIIPLHEHHSDEVLFFCISDHIFVKYSYC
jgi:hypothetical protein